MYIVQSVITQKHIKNKNDNIHKSEAQSDDLTNVDKYRVAANITEYHTICIINVLYKN